MNSDSGQQQGSHLWHPYTDIAAFEQVDCPLIVRAQGAYLHDSEGRALLDGIASWWCVNLGHGHPSLVAAIRDQAAILQHTILGGQAHPRAMELAARLAGLAPGDLTRVFFAGDGASAVEAALKIALQFWTNKGEEGRTRFICLEDGYHGDTLGAVGVGFVPAFHRPFEPVIRRAHRAPSPHCAQCPCDRQPETCDVECFAGMEELIRRHHAETAAVILEPLCQGAAGMRIYPGEYLRRLRRLCDEFGLLFIADEIAVGFGRTGSMFACEHAGVAPDMMTVGKGLTGGYMPMSATLVAGRIYDSFRSTADQDRTFYHGHTYCGNPITSALALAALDVYEEEDIPACLTPRITQLAEGMHVLGPLLAGSRVSTLGMIGTVELNTAAGGMERARRVAGRARELGLFVRPMGPAIYLWPPLNITEDECGRMLQILEQAVRDTGRA